MFFGGHRHTQSLDISHAASLVSEHELDCWGEGAWAQMDIRSYYDELPILDIAQFLVFHGCHTADVAAAVRHQLFVTLEFEFHGHTAFIPSRSRGGLTGSRIASLLQRIPVEHSLLHCHESLRLCGLRCGSARLCAASYIDNLYFPSRFGSSAVTNAELVEARLKNEWGLCIKDGSKQVVLSRGQRDDDIIGDEWTVEDTSDILERLVSGDNSIRPSFTHVKARLWKSFYANIRVKHWRKLGVCRRLQLIDRAVKPHLLFHSAAWPPQRQVASEVDRLQRKMVATALGLYREPAEDIAAFKRRVGRECSRAIATKWSELWYSSAISWHDHLLRDWDKQRKHFDDGVPAELLSTNFAWSPALITTWGTEWVDAHRVYSNSGFKRVSRLFRRSCSGHVNMRWAEGINMARAHPQ